MITIPNIFAAATGVIPLSELDANFAALNTGKIDGQIYATYIALQTAAAAGSIKDGLYIAQDSGAYQIVNGILTKIGGGMANPKLTGIIDSSGQVIVNLIGRSAPMTFTLKTINPAASIEFSPDGIGTYTAPLDVGPNAEIVNNSMIACGINRPLDEVIFIGSEGDIWTAL